jgi:glycosyltransferase involved in cell wall biosynthesis
MKILIIADSMPFKEDSGSRIRAANLLRSLAGHEVYLIGFEEEGAGFAESDLKEICAEIHCFKRPELPSFSKWMNHFSLKPLLAKRLYHKDFERKVKDLITDKAIDVCVAETLLMAEYARESGTAFKVLDEHNLEFIRSGRRFEISKGWLQKPYNFLSYWRLKRYELRTISEFDCCFVCSPEDEKIVKGSIPNQNVVVIPNTVDRHFFGSTPRDPESHKLVYIGTMWYEPNRDAVRNFYQEVMPLIRADFPDVNLVIVGNQPDGEVEFYAQKNDVTLTGYVEDIRPFLSQAAVCIVPLRMGSGTRIKILAAMAAGVPVVSSSIGCEGLEVEDGKNIAIADNPSDFSNKISRFLLDRDLRDQVGSAGRILIEKRYSNEIGMKILKDFWDNLSRTMEKNTGEPLDPKASSDE